MPAMIEARAGGRSMTDAIKAAMVRALMLQIPSQTGAGLVVAFLMISTAWPYNPTPLILGWGAAMLTAVFARWAVSRAFHRLERSDDALAGWAGLYALAMTGIGTMYGIAFLLFAHPGEPITIALTLAALYSVAAGSVPTAAYHFPAILGAVIPAFGAVLLKLLLAGTFVYIVLGIACALYGVTMIAYCRVQAGELRDGFRIRFENVELVEQLRLKTAAAEQANLAKSQFLAAASHDLRQPLYALSLFSSSLEELQLDGSGREVVRRIQDSIGAMERSFEGLLDLSKLEAGIVKPRLEPVEVEALFDRIAQVFGPLAAERGLELRFRSDGERVSSDRVLLEQVVSNLVSNALRATTEGGVLVAARRRKEALGIEIWDTGRGIAPEDLERIFEDYVQLDNPQRDRRRGLGLGLAIARRSLALLDAPIHVASRIGRGSRFGFSLPYHRENGPAAMDGPAVDFRVLRRGPDPLLVVEDDEDVRAAFCDLLQRWGIAYRAVADADAGLDCLQSDQTFSLLVTDQRLTGRMNGITLVRAMRSRLTDPPPAIIVTGEVDPLLLRAAAAEDILVLQKPVRAQQLRCLLGASADLNFSRRGAERPGFS